MFEQIGGYVGAGNYRYFMKPKCADNESPYRKNWDEEPLENFPGLNEPITAVNTLTFEFPRDRFAAVDDAVETLVKDIHITYMDVLNFIDKFYDRVLDVEEIEDLRRAEAFDEESEGVTRIDVMGDCLWFEGLTLLHNGHWLLKLGS